MIRSSLRFGICAGLAAIMTAAAHGSALAQDGPQQVRIASGLNLDSESVQARIKKIETSERLDADAKAQAVGLYQEALEQLELAGQWQRRLDGLQALDREQPRMLAAVRRELAAATAAAEAAIPTGAALGSLDSQLTEATASLESLRKGAADVEARIRELAERRMRLPTELAAARISRESLLGQIDLPPLPSAAAETSIAHQAARLAEDRRATRQQETLELEMSSWERRRELLEAGRDLLHIRIESQRALVDALTAAAGERRAADAQQAAEQASAVQSSLARVHPVLGKLANDSARLAGARSGPAGLVTKIESATAELSAVGALLVSVAERAKGVRQKAEATDFSDAVGLLLRKERAELPDIAEARGRIRSRQVTIADTQLELLTLEDLRSGLPALESEVREILEQQGPTLSQTERSRIETSAADVLRTRREYLDALVRDYNTYFTTLVDLDSRERQLVDAVQGYTRFLDEHVLWIRNTSIPRVGSLADVLDAARWLASPTNWLATFHRIQDKARTDPLFVSLSLLAWSVALLLRPRARRRYHEACGSRSDIYGGPLATTLVAFGLNALMSALWPVLMLIVAWCIESAPSVPDDFSRALAQSLQRTASMLFGLEFLRRTAGRRGTARAFLRFPESALSVARRQILVLETVVVPAFALAFLFDNQPNNEWAISIGRIAFLTGITVIGMTGYRVLNPEGPIGATLHRRIELPWLQRFMGRARWIPVVIATAIGGLSLVGYDFTARELAKRLWWTGWWVFLLALANAVMVRWLAGARQSMAERQVEEGRIVVVTRSEGDVEVTDELADLSVIGAQTRQLLRVLIGAGVALCIFLVWVDVVPALRVLEKVELWSVTASVQQPAPGGTGLQVVETRVPVTAANLALAMLAGLLTILGSRNVPSLLEMTVLQRTGFDQSVRYAITTVCRYAIWVLGIVALFQNLGVAWSHVQWLVAAVSVGLGFGLQEIFANFVSGLILLFERPVRVGDTVTLGGISGTVSKVSMRATTIVDFDRKELIVPNKEFITGQLVNWSLSDSTLRLVVPVAVAYGTDTAVVERLLYEAAKQSARVMETPPPLAVCVRFGDSGIDFELRVFVEGTDAVARTRHDLHVAIDRKFRTAGLEIASPQRDVRIRSVDAPLPVTLQAASDPTPA